jgi:hypothetical protein
MEALSANREVVQALKDLYQERNLRELAEQRVRVAERDSKAAQAETVRLQKVCEEHKNARQVQEVCSRISGLGLLATFWADRKLGPPPGYDPGSTLLAILRVDL